MNITAISIAWAFLQIALLCSIALSFAWSLRGRRPQLVTAILAGSCVASLLLALTALVPTFQWTLAIDEATSRELVPTKQTNLRAPNSIQTSQFGTSQIQSPADNLHANRTVQPTSNDSLTFAAIRTFVSQYLRHVDREVRGAEAWQKPVARARNFSALLFLWVGLGFMSMLWCSGWLYMRRVLRCSQPVLDLSVLNFVASRAREFGLKRTPLVRESNQIPIGATVGWRRVTVLLHTDWREWSPDERVAVISHELAHAARHDFAWVIISSWTRILLFFHPMVHAMIHRMRFEQELAADQLAAGKLGNAKAYGRALASLALRSQQSLATSNAKLGSMLAAGQICVTRRVIMLRQGSLKPISSRSRWSMLAVATIACTAIPLAGLRGTTQEPEVPKTSSNDTTKQKEDPEESKPKPLSKEFQLANPPVEFKGLMVYRPGRFRTGEFGPEAAWLQEWFAISALGKPMPDRAVVYGECTGQLKWSDEERKHGFFGLSAGFREGDSTSPGELSQLLNLFDPKNRKLRTVSKEMIDGRTISGVTNNSTADEPEKWLIDDEQGYFLGSHEQALEFARGQKFALAAIPVAFHDDTINAAFGMVYNNCDQWPSELESFFKDSPRAEEFQILGFKPASNIIKDLLQFGVFFDGCKTPACNVRAVLRDARSAQRFATQVTTLVELGKVAIDAWSTETKATTKEAATKEASSEVATEAATMEAAKSILETMKITVSDSQVLFQFDIFVSSLSQAGGPIAHSSAGWININARAKCESIGSVTVQPEMSFLSQPSLFGQTLNASEYLGKTVLLELEIQCNEEASSESGAFVLASRQEQPSVDAYAGRLPLQQGSPYVGHRVISAKSIAANGSSAWPESIQAEHRAQRNSLTSGAATRNLTIPFTVPKDSQHISFGCYSKNSEIRVSNVKFQVAEELVEQSLSTSGVTDATADIPYSVMVVPGFTIRNAPIELNFEQLERNSVETAARPTGNQTR